MTLFASVKPNTLRLWDERALRLIGSRRLEELAAERQAPGWWYAEGLDPVCVWGGRVLAPILDSILAPSIIATTVTSHAKYVCRSRMRSAEVVSREQFLAHRHGKTFADVLNDPGTRFDEVLEFFNDPERQRRMEDSEIHHDRAPLSGVVRELESEPAFGQVFAALRGRRSARLRQAIGVLVRMIMERRGWRTTGKKGSLGVRGGSDSRTPYHNTGGLSLWFIRAERYERESGLPFRSVRERCQGLEDAESVDSTAAAPAMEEGAPSPRRGSTP